MKANIILATITFIIMLVISEFALRVINPDAPKLPEEPKSNWALVPERVWTEHHPQLGWFHQKNKKAVLQIAQNKVAVEINTNSRGIRASKEYSEEKPQGVTRILVIGDSFPFGFGVKDHEPFPVVLEKKLDKVEALNLSVAGYGIDQMLMMYRVLGKKYSGDIGLICIFPEDFWRATRAFADTGHAKPYFMLNEAGELELKNVPAPKPFELRTNQFPEIIHHGPVMRFFRSFKLFRLSQKIFTKLGKNLKIIDPNTEAEWKLGRAILSQLVAEMKEDGVRPILIIVPPDRWIKNYDMTSLRESLIRYAKRTRLELIDMTPPFYEAVSQATLADYYIEGDGHWTPRGHELAADIIIQHLEKTKT